MCGVGGHACSLNGTCLQRVVAVVHIHWDIIFLVKVCRPSPKSFSVDAELGTFRTSQVDSLSYFGWVCTFVVLLPIGPYSGLWA